MRPTRDGWAHYLRRLATVAAGGDPGPDADVAASPRQTLAPLSSQSRNRVAEMTQVLARRRRVIRALTVQTTSARASRRRSCSPKGCRKAGSPRRFGPWAVGAALALADRDLRHFRRFHADHPDHLRRARSSSAGDGVVVAVLLVFIVMEVMKLRAARKAARAGSRLHTRLVVLFSLVAAIPALFTAVIATVSVEWAINPAFMRNVAAFINESPAPHRSSIASRNASRCCATPISPPAISRALRSLLKENREVFQNYLDARARALSFSVGGDRHDRGRDHHRLRRLPTGR